MSTNLNTICSLTIIKLITIIELIIIIKHNTANERLNTNNEQLNMFEQWNMTASMR